MIRPKHKFVTVVADPPWDYGSQDFRKKKAPDGSYPHAGIGPKDSYPRMSTKNLCSLGVKEITSSNSHLYLWVTNNFMGDGWRVCKSWGYRPITILTWTKVKKDDPCSPSCKTGTYFRGATEHVIFGVKGSLKLNTDRAIPTGFMSPRLPHSVKPEWFYDLMDEVNCPGPRLDLFARKNREGWFSWGNQVDDPVYLPELLRPLG